jgi:hypothetical protein
MVNLSLLAAYEALRDRPAGADVRLTSQEAAALYAHLRRLAALMATVERLDALEPRERRASRA